MKKLVVVLSVIVVLLSVALIFVLTKPSGQENLGSSSSLQQSSQNQSSQEQPGDENGFPLDLFEISDPLLDSNLPTSPTLSAGYCDAGYEIVVGGDGSFIVNKSANAGQWTGAMLAVADYSSVYSAFTIKFTTDNVTNLNIQLIVGGGDPTWPKYITVHHSIVQDGEHELLIDFSEILVVDANWNAIPNCYIKDYNIEAIMITLDTAVDASALINEDASCIVHDVTFNAKQ